MSNRRRHANVLPIASLATWIALAAFACCAGLYYVYCKHQVTERGYSIHRLEKELSELRTLNEGARTRISKLDSPAALRRRRESGRGFLASYVEIPQASLVMVSAKADDFRAVSNLQH